MKGQFYMKLSPRLKELLEKLPPNLQADWDGTNHYELQDPYGKEFFWLQVEEAVGDCTSEEGQRLGLVLDIIEEISKTSKETATAQFTADDMKDFANFWEHYQGHDKLEEAWADWLKENND